MCGSELSAVQKVLKSTPSVQGEGGRRLCFQTFITIRKHMQTYEHDGREGVNTAEENEV